MGTIIAVTAAAGMGGTGLGGLAAYLFRRGTDRTVSVLLSFAAGMMLAVVCADLLTDAIQAGPGLSALPAASASVLAGCGGIWLLEELVSGLQAGAKRGGLFLAGVVMATPPPRRIHYPRHPVAQLISYCILEFEYIVSTLH